MILIVTNKQDITADLVVLRLQERSISYVRFNTEDFPTEVGITWRLVGSTVDGTLELPRGSLPIEKISAVWYRRPSNPRASPIVDDLLARTFIIEESEASLRNLWSLMDVFWVSHPDAIRGAGNKLEQLSRATAHNLEVPHTLLTTSPVTAKAFCLAHEQVIAKSVGKGFVDDGESATALMYTNLLSATDLERLDSVRLAPTLFQAYVPKAFDLRVTVVGQTLFATEIHADSDQRGQIDWRRGEVGSLRHVAHEIPEVLAQRVRELVRSYGLQFSAIDFVVTRDGRYVFLEINPNGQWAWIEQMIQTPISSAVADLLVGQGPRL